MDAALAAEARLLNEFQRGFPLVREPFALIARRLDADESWVRARLAAWIADGTVSRVGAVIRPGTVGVSTLAALEAPANDLVRVAGVVSARPEVNHNYERDHRLNLWFVATAPDRARLDATLASIAGETGCRVVSLPLVNDYWIDLGFDLATGAAQRTTQAIGTRGTPSGPIALSTCDRRLLAALEGGLPIVSRPYRALGEAANLSEARGSAGGSAPA
jgi:DNA-binding Lrp family transcriptional regulator